MKDLVELIYPADQKIIDRNRKKEFTLFIEKYDFYLKVIFLKINK